MKVGDLVKPAGILLDVSIAGDQWSEMEVGLVTECTSEGSDGQLLLVYWHRGKREWLMLDEVERINV